MTPKPAPGSMPGNIGKITREQNTQYYRCTECGAIVGIDVYNSGTIAGWVNRCPMCGAPVEPTKNPED